MTTETLREAAEYALAFMNDPEGLAAVREEWRDRLRAALVDGQAVATAERRAIVARIRAELADPGGRHIDAILDEQAAR